jgi:hypothetical protein
MSNLTINPMILVESLPDDHSLVISTNEAILIKCTRCGQMKDVSLHDDPSPQELAPGGVLRTGSISYPFMRQCECRNARNFDGDDLYSRMRDVYEQALKCRGREAILQMLYQAMVRER